MLASPLFMQSREDRKSSRIPTASRKAAAMIQGEEQVQSVLKLITREEKVWCQIRLKNREHRGNLLQCFHKRTRKREEFYFQTRWSVKSGLSEGNKDHLLSQGRAEIMKREHQVESLNNCISELQQQTYAQRLELQDAQHGYIKSRREQVRLQEEVSLKEKVLRDAQIRNVHEMGEIKRAQEPWDFSVAGNARSDEFYEWFRRISRSGIKLQWDCLTFPVNLQWFQVLFPCWAATNACLLTHGIHLDYKKTFLVINFLRLIHPEIIFKEFTRAHHKENKDQLHKLQRQGPYSQEMTSKM